MSISWWKVKQISLAIFWFGLLANISLLVGYFTNIFVVLLLTAGELCLLLNSKNDETHDWEVVYAILKVAVIISLVSMWGALIIGEIVLG